MGSEMCIRDSPVADADGRAGAADGTNGAGSAAQDAPPPAGAAAEERARVLERAEAECAWYLEDHGCHLALSTPAAPPTPTAAGPKGAPKDGGLIFPAEEASAAPAAAEARAGGADGEGAPQANGGTRTASELQLDCKASRGSIVDQSISEAAEAERREAERLASISRITF